MEILVGVMSGVLVAMVTWLVLNSRRLPKNSPEFEKQATLEQYTELARVLMEEQVRGIRSVLGLDLGGEIVKEEEEKDDTPIAIVNQLEMDPFMMTEEEWLDGKHGSNQETNQ